MLKVAPNTLQLLNLALQGLGLGRKSIPLESQRLVLRSQAPVFLPPLWLSRRAHGHNLESVVEQPLLDCLFLVCGPPPLMAAMRTLLIVAGVSARPVIVEDFEIRWVFATKLPNPTLSTHHQSMNTKLKLNAANGLPRTHRKAPPGTVNDPQETGEPTPG